MEWKEDASVEVTFKKCEPCKGSGKIDGATCAACEGKGSVLVSVVHGGAT